MGYVYFISDGAAIKIGRSAYPGKRLAGLQTGSQAELELLGILHDPTESRERELHEQFAALRIRGEWFRAEAPLTDFIATLPPYEVAPKPPRPDFDVWFDRQSQRGWPSPEVELEANFVLNYLRMSRRFPLPRSLKLNLAEHARKLELAISKSVL